MRIFGLEDNFQTSFEVMRAHLSLDRFDIDMTFEKADGLYVGVKGGRGYIRCREVHHMNRLLALFAGYYKGEDFEISEKAAFKTLSVMIDISYRGPISLGGLKEYFTYLGSMGYNQIWFYAEDMYEMPAKYAHFGYMRGRYSTEELRELDDFAYSIGIEIVPCIQTLGHMQHYLRWDEAYSYRETNMILRPDSPKVDEFIRDMLIAASKPFRSKRIHVGLDETAGLGMGKSFKPGNYREPLDIFVDHVAKVAKMCEELGLRPMMWNDMVFCYSNKNHARYAFDTEIAPETLAKWPKNMDPVYWNYEVENCHEVYIDKNRVFGNPVIFAGGVWIWVAALPDNIWSEKFHRGALAACKKKGVEEVCLTVWAFGMTIYQTSLLEAARYAEWTYEEDDAKLAERFEIFTGASFDGFYDMSNYHAQYLEGEIDYDSMTYEARFDGNKFMWQDIMLGLYDENLFREPRAEHYKRAADRYLPLIQRRDKWCWLYEYCYTVFTLLSVKCYIAERLVPAYKSGDRDMLRFLLEEKLPALERLWYDLADRHERHRDDYMRPFGVESNHRRYGTMIMRTRYAIHRLEDYLHGKVDRLAELEEPRFFQPPAAWGADFGSLTEF